MIDREKVIKGLECCADGDCKEQECPYHHNLPEDWNKFDCNTELARDALELFKDQVPKILTLDEVRGTRGEPVWMDVADSDNEPKIDSYVREYSLTDVDTKECIHHVIFEHSRQTLEDGYNRYWRCWSAKPSEEQWLNTKWDN